MIDLNKIAIIAGEHNVTYSELLQRVAQFARKTPKGKLTKTVIFSENREGWAYAFFAIWMNEGIVVPVDASSTVSDVAYILNDCQPDAAWVSKEREAVLKEAIAEANVEVSLMGHGDRPCGSSPSKGDYRDVTVAVGDTKWSGLGLADMYRLKGELAKYSHLFDNVATKDLYFSYGNFTPDVEGFPVAFRKFSEPCDEFKELSKLVMERYGMKLKVDDLYEVSLFGKSGRYGESGERRYTAFDKLECRRCINEIKSYGNRKTVAAIRNFDDIDTMHSRTYLTECYGDRRRSLDINIA